MARTKRQPIPLEAIDTNNTDPAYWEDILRREGLSMDRGLFPSNTEENRPASGQN